MLLTLTSCGFSLSLKAPDLADELSMDVMKKHTRGPQLKPACASLRNCVHAIFRGKLEFYGGQTSFSSGFDYC